MRKLCLRLGAVLTLATAVACAGKAPLPDGVEAPPSVTQQFEPVKDQAVAAGKEVAVNLASVLASAAAAELGVPLDDPMLDAINLGFRSLVGRININATVYDSRLAEACGEARRAQRITLDPELARAISLACG